MLSMGQVRLTHFLISKQILAFCRLFNKIRCELIKLFN